MVAQAEPAIPHPSPKMNSWLSTALVEVVNSVIASVTRGRPTPLKKPNIAHTAAPTNAPPMRGNQKAAASRSICGSKPKGARIRWRAAPTSTNSGAANAIAHSAVHTACPARA